MAADTAVTAVTAELHIGRRQQTAAQEVPAAAADTVRAEMAAMAADRLEATEVTAQAEAADAIPAAEAGTE